MQRQLLVPGVEVPEAAGELDILRCLGTELELGAIDSRLGRVSGAEARSLASGQRKGVEELLVAIIVVKDCHIERRPPLPELDLGASLVRVESLGLSEGELCRRIECLSVEGSSAVPLAEVCVDQYF